MKLSIQSWCFRTWDQHDQLIAATKECGLDCIEQGQRFIDPLINEKYMDVVKQYRENGLTISGYGVLKFNTDAELSRKWFEFAQAIGISSIVADFSLGEELETAALLEPLCEEFDVDIAIHNHGRRHHLGAPYALDRVFAQTSTNIGLCLDTAWMLDSGCDPVDIAQKYSNRLYGVHVKDFIFDRAGKSEDTIVGQGNLRLDDLVKLLADQGYGGYLTLEYEGDIEDPLPASKRCVEEMKAALGRL